MTKLKKFALTFKKGIMLIKMKYKNWFKTQFTIISGKQKEINYEMFKI